MKIYGNKLTATLKNGIHPVYIISGDEPLLVQEASDQVRATLMEQGYDQRDLFHADGNFDWNELRYGANSMSLFAERKILEVRMSSSKPGEPGVSVLNEVVEQITDDVRILLVMPRVDATTQRTKWFKSIESAGLFVQVWPIDAKELPGWLAARFKREGLQVSREAAMAMAERIEGNLLAAVQEIERLKLVARDGRVDLDQVVDGVADSARYDVFQVIDAALAGDSTRVVRMTHSLEAEGVEILFLVNMLARELRNLEQMASLLEGGTSMREALKKGRVWDKRTNPVSRCLERHDVAVIRQLQVDLGHIDREVKGIEVGDPWRDLVTVLMRLGGAKMPDPRSKVS